MMITNHMKRPVRALMALVLLCAWTGSPGTASAQNASVRAANLAESANRLGRTGEYAAALELFEQAYALDPQPVLLYNIGRVAERLKDWKKAAGALRAYIEVATDAEQKAKAEQVLGEVEARLPAWLSVAASVDGAVVVAPGEARAITLALDRLPPPPPLPPPATVLAKPANLTPTPLHQVERGSGLLPPSPLDGEGGQGGEVWYKKWWVWTMTGAVVAGGVTAAVLLTQGGGAQPALDGEWMVQ